MFSNITEIIKNQKMEDARKTLTGPIKKKVSKEAENKITIGLLRKLIQRLIKRNTHPFVYNEIIEKHEQLFMSDENLNLILTAMENEIEKELNGLYNTMKKPTVSPQIQQKGGINQSVQMQQDIQQQPKINIGIKK